MPSSHSCVLMVLALFYNIDSAFAPMTNNRTGLILIGSLTQIQYDAHQG
jgi:hypothetical protein